MEGLTLFEALDDAAACLRRDGMDNLARAVERAATLLGQGHAADREPLPRQALDEGRHIVAELNRAIDALRRLRLRPRPTGEDLPAWLVVVDDTLRDHVTIGTPYCKQLEACHDALAIVSTMKIPDDVAELVRATLAAMPRAVRRFGRAAVRVEACADLAPDDDGR